jgi:hypothetical protein
MTGLATPLDISSVLSEAKAIEYMVTTFDPAHKDMVAAISLVKQFIIDHGLIVYGGTAIDMALRLKGDNIYPDDMLAVPDLDFYSPTNVVHAYQLADILFDHGYTASRAIVAEHMETMRVDLVSNHWIADITYRPQAIFDSLPYLTYDGIRIIHPDFQRIDVHSSLSFPYDNPPREVIFARWKKDIVRFNKLAALYPINPVGDALPLRPMTIDVTGHILDGFAAYAAIHHAYTGEMSVIGGAADVPTPLLPVVDASFGVSDSGITFNTLNQTCEIIHYDPKKAATRLGLADVKRYESYINLIPDRIEGTRGPLRVAVASTGGRLVGVNTITIDGSIFRVVNVQYLLKHFLSMHFINHSSPKVAAVYLNRYVSLLNMIGNICVHGPAESVLFPSVRTYGNENINLARSVAIARLMSELRGAAPIKVPQNYYPGRSRANGRGHPPFDPSTIEFFHESGEEIPM